MKRRDVPCQPKGKSQNNNQTIKLKFHQKIIKTIKIVKKQSFLDKTTIKFDHLDPLGDPPGVEIIKFNSLLNKNYCFSLQF